MPPEIKIPEQKWEEAAPEADYFVRKNGPMTTGLNPTTGRPHGHGDERSNVVDDEDYFYNPGGAGVGASAGLPGTSKFHSRDEGSMLYGHGGDDLIRGFGGNDRLDGGTGNDTLYGGTGHDQIWGGDGNYFDILYGEDGNDTLDGGQGGDIMYGGRGNDVYVADNARDWIVEDASAEGGEDKIYTTLPSYDLSVYGKGLYVEHLQYNGTGNFVGKGNELNNIIDGSTGHDKLYGQAGHDRLNGGNGADTLEGGSGDDTLNGGAGADAMYGGSGNDVYIVDDPGDRVIESSPWSLGQPSSDTLRMPASGGTDTIFTSLETYDMSAPDKGAGVEGLVYTGTGNFTGNFQGHGNELANWILSAAGNDELMGAGGDDLLCGGSGSDQLDGGADNDLLVGEVGHDILLGGAGNDVLTGGEGNDTFVFRDHGDHDTITDFTRGLDKINVGGVSAVHSFEDLKLTDTSDGVRVDFGDSSVLVQGQTAASMTEADFSFGRYTPLPSITLESAIVDPFGPGIDRVSRAHHGVLDTLPVTQSVTSMDSTSFAGAPPVGGETESGGSSFAQVLSDGYIADHPQGLLDEASNAGIIVVGGYDAGEEFLETSPVVSSPVASLAESSSVFTDSIFDKSAQTFVSADVATELMDSTGFAGAPLVGGESESDGSSFAQVLSDGYIADHPQGLLDEASNAGIIVVGGYAGEEFLETSPVVSSPVASLAESASVFTDSFFDNSAQTFVSADVATEFSSAASHYFAWG